MALPGCIVIPKPKPFERPIEAQQLRQIAPPTAVAAAQPQPAPNDTPTVTPPPPNPPSTTPEPPPARTDIKGEGDGSMKLDRVTITAKDIPHRAPNYSPEQMASMVCAAQKSGFNLDGARKAHAATVAAKEMRERLAAGTATLKQSDQAELARQDAVRNFSAPGPLVGLIVALAGGNRKKDDLPKPRFEDVVIENPDLFTFKENGKEVMAVSGVIRNTGKARVQLPPLTLEAIDEWDFVLAGQSALLPFEYIEPGESRTFELRYLNPPEYTAEVYVHFAPPFAYRGRRDCDFFDPSTFDANDSLDAVTARPRGSPRSQVTSDAPGYTAAELNILTQYYRRESATVWRCRDADKRGCYWAAHALPWRDMFTMAEAIDEAWIALRAAEESARRLAAGTGTQAEADKAELARNVAIRKFSDMGDRALARAGGSVKDVVVDLASSNFGRDKKGLFVEFSGTLRNTGTEPRTIDALMVAFVDRFELPLSSVAVDFPKVLAPGESAPFSQRIDARQNNGPNSIDIEFGPGTKAQALARVPPQEIPWKVRVGAMGK